MMSTSTSYSTVTAAPPSTSSVKTDHVKLPSTPSSNPSSSQPSEPLVLSKKCAIVFPNVDSIHVDKYFVAVGEIIGFKNIIFGGKSGQRMVMHLANEDLVDTFVNTQDHVMINGELLPVKKLVNPGFKVIFNHVNPSVPNELLLQEISKYAQPISPITYISTGLRDERLRHIFSYKRQVYVNNKDAIPNSIQISHGSELNTIYLNMDNSKCYSCGMEGHSIKNCPSKDSVRQPAQDRMIKNMNELAAATHSPSLSPDNVSSQPHSSKAEVINMFAPSFFPALEKKTIPEVPVVEEHEGKISHQNTPDPSDDLTMDVSPTPVLQEKVNEEISHSPMETEDRKSSKRSISPLKKSAQNVEEKKVKIDGEFHENFVKAIEATLIKVNSTLSKDDLLKLFRETKNVRNKYNVITKLGLDIADLKIVLTNLIENKISPNMKTRIRTLCKHIDPETTSEPLTEDTGIPPQEKNNEVVNSDVDFSDGEPV
ncbi:hypothetical protein M8J77_020105 [Diaphorina citri]|nr:hypothetical protein M8J77_020105 [Diaphorina citri]